MYRGGIRDQGQGENPAQPAEPILLGLQAVCTRRLWVILPPTMVNTARP